ncbi:DUF1840 domain-containing protein [Aquabacterium sp. J223]|uniref:DUF1840 domain-containing protein n=1 Tax=Aquabacterium sp. J223 TaxID=2898431 RepID=UPI0021ADAFC2|nr:DUF1840 domain-containing protein [Aquabacterium sp. J223]UUX95983.1 DUF1840 domain-containing protein [Aquabacterium sp. J223]
MLYKFKTRNAGDVIMTGPHGDHVLELLGRPPAASGIFEAAHLPSLVERLQQAVVAEEAERERLEREAAERGEKPPRGEAVALRQRVWPLVEMMKRAAARDEDIVWGL